MPAAIELRLEKGPDYGLRLLCGEPLAGKGDHVGIVVTAAHFGFIGVVGVYRPDPGHLVGDDRNPVPGSADENPAITVPGGNQTGCLTGERRVIGRFGRVGADIGDFVAFRLKELPHGFLEFEPGVICGHGDLHPAEITRAPVSRAVPDDPTAGCLPSCSVAEHGNQVTAAHAAFAEHRPDTVLVQLCQVDHG